MESRVWKELQLLRHYSLAAYSKIVRTSVKIGKTRLFPPVLIRAQERISEQASNWSTSFPESSLFLPRESTLVAAGHVSMYTNQIRTGGGSLT